MAEDLYNRLLAHLRSADPATTPLDTRLFDEAELVLPTYLTGTDARLDQRHSLMRILAADLTDTRRADHTPAVDLLIRLFEPFSWSQIVEFGTQSVPFKDGLAVGEGEWMVPFNRLMLALLEKATGSPADAGQVAGMLETMLALVRLWLRTADVGVAGRCAALIYDLLRVDSPGAASQHGPGRGGGGRAVGAQGLVWKRVFGDRDVYNAIFESTSLTKGLEALGKNQKTVAQARLLEWLPRVAALNWEAVSRSHLREVEERYGTKSLLDYAALQMVDYEDDVLMHRCLIDFYSDLLRATANLDTHTMPQHDSPGLQYLITNGLHVRATEIFLQTRPIDPVDSMFLYGCAANYLATYAEEYKTHFLASDTASQVKRRLLQTLDLTPGRWAHSDSPKHDLHVLASLPRAALLPFPGSPLALLPSRSPNADVLNTLAVIFHGPRREILYPPPPPTTPQPNHHHHQKQQQEDLEEASAARALYFNYLAHNPRFWHDITSHADTLALKDLALAALNLLTSAITAHWSTAPSFPLPTATIATPETGHLAILSPPALEYVLPYLLKPPVTYANLVGGRGDTEAAAYRVAAWKFDALRALKERLQVQVERQPDEGFEEILATLKKRLVQGVVPTGAQVGGAVGTLEL